MVPTAPCSLSCCLLAKISSSSAHILLFILLTFVQKTASVLCSKRTLEKSFQVFTGRYSLGAALGANRELNSLEHPSCL